MAEDLYSQMAQTVIDGELELAEELARKGLAAGLPPADILDKGFVKGIEEVGDLFGKGEFFLPELVQGAEAMKAAVAVLQPELDKRREAARRSARRWPAPWPATSTRSARRSSARCSVRPASRSPTSAATWPSRPSSRRSKSRSPTCLLLSALLTTTMPNQQKTIEALKTAGLRDCVKVMIGGAPTTRAWADEIGADGYSEDAIEAVVTAKQLLGVG